MMDDETGGGRNGILLMNRAVAVTNNILIFWAFADGFSLSPTKMGLPHRGNDPLSFYSEKPLCFAEEVSSPPHCKKKLFPRRRSRT